MVRGNLPLKFALSKRRRLFEEWHVDAEHAVAPGGIYHFLNNHLPHERNGNTFHTMDDLIRAAHVSTLEIGTVVRIHRWRMLACLRHELLEPQSHEVGHPMLQPFNGLRRWLWRPVFEFMGDLQQQALEAIQAVLHRRQALCNIFHKSPLSVDVPAIMVDAKPLLWSAVTSGRLWLTPLC
jgi:hypothetical protein